MEKYRQSTTFPDEVFIEVHVEEFKGVRLKLRYRMERADQKTVCEAWSEHCFLDREGKLIRLDKRSPEFDQVLRDLVKQEQDDHAAEE